MNYFITSSIKLSIILELHGVIFSCDFFFQWTPYGYLQVRVGICSKQNWWWVPVLRVAIWSARVARPALLLWSRFQLIILMEKKMNPIIHKDGDANVEIGYLNPEDNSIYIVPYGLGFRRIYHHSSASILLVNIYIIRYLGESSLLFFFIFFFFSCMHAWWMVYVLIPN